MKLGHKSITKQIQDLVSFAAMSVLIFVLVSLSHSEIFESYDAVDTIWNLHWIDCHRRFDVHQNAGIYSFENLRPEILWSLTALSLCLTWILSKVLHRLRKHD